MSNKMITFIKDKGFAVAGYTAAYPADQAEALIESGFAKPVETKFTRHIEKVEKTSFGGKIKKLSKDKGKGDN
jgi:hypothetical protein